MSAGERHDAGAPGDLPPEPVDTPGWDALDAALGAVYPDDEPFLSRAVLPYALGGPDPIEGIQAYWNAEPAHWHLITFGFSELYTADEADDPAVSGYGFELTLRLPGPLADAPPDWALDLLQSLGRYVFESGHPFLAGDQLRCDGPIAPLPAPLAGISFAPDPALPPALATPNGEVQLLQVVGLHPDELDAALAWSCEGLLALLAQRDPLLLTDPERGSLLADADAEAQIRTGIARDGSSLGSALTPSVRWEPEGDGFRLTLGARAVNTLRDLLRGRTLHGKPFSLVGADAQVDVLPGEAPAAVVDQDPDDDDDDGVLTVTLTPDLARALADQLAPQRGEHRWPDLPALVLEIAPTEITDPEGNPLETIG